MYGGQTYLTFPFWRKTIKSSIGVPFNIMEDFSSRIKIKPNFKKLSIENIFFEIEFDITWKIINFDVFKTNLELFMYNVEMYNTVNLDGNMEVVLDNFLYHIINFDKYIRKMGNNDNILSFHFTEAFNDRALKDNGIKILTHTRRKCNEVIINWRKINNETDFKNVLKILKNRDVLPISG